MSSSTRLLRERVKRAARQNSSSKTEVRGALTAPSSRGGVEEKKTSTAGEGRSSKKREKSPSTSPPPVSYTHLDVYKRQVQVFLQRDDAPAADELYRIETALTGGPGSITHSQLDIQRGEERTITWSANPGYLVTAVVVDGETRDDLLRAGSFTFADIDRDHYLDVYKRQERYNGIVDLVYERRGEATLL